MIFLALCDLLNRSPTAWFRGHPRRTPSSDGMSARVSALSCEIVRPVDDYVNIQVLGTSGRGVTAWAGATPVLGGAGRPSPRALTRVGAGGRSRPCCSE